MIIGVFLPSTAGGVSCTLGRPCPTVRFLARCVFFSFFSIFLHEQIAMYSYLIKKVSKSQEIYDLDGDADVDVDADTRRYVLEDIERFRTLTLEIQCPIESNLRIRTPVHISMLVACQGGLEARCRVLVLFLRQVLVLLLVSEDSDRSKNSRATKVKVTFRSARSTRAFDMSQ
jgi:hypothetical protein